MAGKGRGPEKGVDWKKYRESPYWNKTAGGECKHKFAEQIVTLQNGAEYRVYKCCDCNKEFEE